MLNNYTSKLPPAVLTGEEWIYSNTFAKHKLPVQIRKSLTFAILFFDNVVFPSPPGLNKFTRIFGSVAQDSLIDYFKINFPQPEVYKDWLLPLYGAGRAVPESPSIDFYNRIKKQLRAQVEVQTKILSETRNINSIKDAVIKAKFAFEKSYLTSIPMISMVNRGAVPLELGAPSQIKAAEHNLADVYLELSKASITLLAPEMPDLHNADAALEIKSRAEVTYP